MQSPFIRPVKISAAAASGVALRPGRVPVPDQRRGVGELLVPVGKGAENPLLAPDQRVGVEARLLLGQTEPDGHPAGTLVGDEAARVAADPTASITTSYSPDRSGRPRGRRGAGRRPAWYGDRSVTSTRPAPPDSAVAAHGGPMAPHPMTATPCALGRKRQAPTA